MLRSVGQWQNIIMDHADEYRASVSCSVSKELKSDLEAIADLVQAVAQRHRTDSIALLTLLRLLEASHREVRDGVFQDAMPKSRQQLYSFLRALETEGGWPYIPRMKLRSLIALLDSPLQAEVEQYLTEKKE